MSTSQDNVRELKNSPSLLDSFLDAWIKIEKTLGNMKCAVVIILIFSAMMIVGTFVESYYGTDFAGRSVYKTLPFMMIQFLMFLSIYFATVQRLPMKKRLYGFYVIHAGLIMIFCGSFITWLAGIDGMIDLNKNEPSRTIVLSEDRARLFYVDTGKYVNFKLPYSAFKTDIDYDYEGIKLKDFLPFSEQKQIWVKPHAPYQDGQSSSQYMIFNANVSQDFTMSLHKDVTSLFKPNLNLGPLTINYLEDNIFKCLKLESKSKLVIWNDKKRTCVTPESRGISIQKTEAGNRFLVFKEDGELLSFFPEFSPLPLDNSLSNFVQSHVRVLSKKLIEDKPTLLLFGDKVAFYDDKTSETPQWVFKEFSKENNIVSLPWMGFRIRLLKHSRNEIPSFTPEYTLPIQKNGEMIKGGMKALKIEHNGKEQWVTDRTPIEIMHNGQRAFISLTKETLTLPFELTLTRFKMDKNPGTEQAASYESFVRLFTSEGSSEHHIFMNNPLKYDSFTFYQSSYFKNPQTGEYSSSLSANIDQGRPLKYLGSLLLVLGAIWHYVITRKRYSTKNRNQA